MAVLRDADLGPLADNLPAEADPVSPPELEPDARSLGEGGPNGWRRLGRLEDEEEHPGPPGEGDEPGNSIGEGRRAAGWTSVPDVQPVARAGQAGRRWIASR
jgi:hypothetical protein